MAGNTPIGPCVAVGDPRTARSSYATGSNTPDAGNPRASDSANATGSRRGKLRPVVDCDLSREFHRLFKEPKKTAAERTRACRQRKQAVARPVVVPTARVRPQGEFALARCFKRLFKEPAMTGRQRMMRLRQKRKPHITSTLDRNHKGHTHYTPGCGVCRRALDRMPKNAADARAYEPGYQVWQECDRQGARAKALTGWGDQEDPSDGALPAFARPPPERYMEFPSNTAGVKRSQPAPPRAPTRRPQEAAAEAPHEILPETVDYRPSRPPRVSRVQPTDTALLDRLKEEAKRLAKRFAKGAKEYGLRKRAEMKRRHPALPLLRALYKQRAKDENLLEEDEEMEDNELE